MRKKILGIVFAALTLVTVFSGCNSRNNNPGRTPVPSVTVPVSPKVSAPASPESSNNGLVEESPKQSPEASGNGTAESPKQSETPIPASPKV